MKRSTALEIIEKILDNCAVTEIGLTQAEEQVSDEDFDVTIMEAVEGWQVEKLIGILAHYENMDFKFNLSENIIRIFEERKQKS